jgi:hypothetical protein
VRACVRRPRHTYSLLGSKIAVAVVHTDALAAALTFVLSAEEGAMSGELWEVPGFDMAGRLVSELVTS